MNNTPVHFTVVINFVLALIPFLLALYLFKFSKHRSLVWWLLLPVFIAFLPNSAYVLTDIIHFIAAVKSPDISSMYLILVVVPFYILFISTCFEFYVLSVRFGHQYIEKLAERNAKLTWLAISFVPVMHILSAIGVYLGRFQRLESTDIIHNPLIVFKDLLLDFTGERSLLIMLGLFLIFTLLYFAFNKLNTQIYQRFQYWLAIRKGLNDPYIYLLSSQVEYQQALSKGELIRDSITDEGFIHAAPKNQLTRIANKYYKETIDPMIVVVDKNKITAEVKWEPATGGLYPHIYGAMNTDAIHKVIPIALSNQRDFLI